MTSVAHARLPLTAALIGLLFAQLAPAAPLDPIEPEAWSRRHAVHLLERAGFGGSPEMVDYYAALTPRQAVGALVHAPEKKKKSKLPAFDHSGIFKPGLDPFPPSRPATTAMAAKNGEALGIKVATGVNRPMQAIVNEFFYWLRASRLETDRVAYWWAERMLTNPHMLQEKMALFWHGHFATNEDKVRDYRKMLKQLELFEREGLGNFRTLVIRVAQDPAMLAFLDAGVNVKGSPNENFAREIMELFTMGVGNYTEEDIREAARAFTGWNFVGTEFRVNQDQFDDAPKTFLGRTGNFDGVEIIDIILEQPATARYIAAKLYRYFVRDDLDPELNEVLAERLRAGNYELLPFLETLFLSQDFYADASMGARIKSPVEFMVSTYRKLGLDDVPGAPDFNLAAEDMGQRLMHPPTVAGWSYGRSWITPGLLLERGNFVLDVLFPDVTFIPGDLYAAYPTGDEIRAVHERLRAGEDITLATRPAEAEAADLGDEMMAMSSDVEREEDFNTRYGSYRGWQMAIERVKPIPRDLARIDLTGMVVANELATPLEVVRYFERRFFAVELDESVRAELAAQLERQLGTSDVLSARTYLEEPLRVTLHLLLSRPEYQLG